MLGETSVIAQGIGRAVDKSIGTITSNPCRGGEVYYKKTHGRPRWLAADVALVADIDYPNEKIVTELTAYTCKKAAWR